MKLTDCSPVVYHVPIVVGDSDEFYTYYLVKKPVVGVIPIGESYYAKLVGATQSKPAWYIQTTVAQSSRAIKDTSHSFIAPDYPKGFSSAEQALEHLLEYRRKTYGD